jgi:hypothetical protein
LSIFIVISIVLLVIKFFVDRKWKINAWEKTKQRTMLDVEKRI